MKKQPNRAGVARKPGAPRRLQAPSVGTIVGDRVITGRPTSRRDRHRYVPALCNLCGKTSLIRVADLLRSNRWYGNKWYTAPQACACRKKRLFRENILRPRALAIPPAERVAFWNVAQGHVFSLLPEGSSLDIRVAHEAIRVTNGEISDFKTEANVLRLLNGPRRNNYRRATKNERLATGKSWIAPASKEERAAVRSLVRKWSHLSTCNDKTVQSIFQAARAMENIQRQAVLQLERTFTRWAKQKEALMKRKLAAAKRSFQERHILTKYELPRKVYNQLARLLIPRGLAERGKDYLLLTFAGVVWRDGRSPA